MNTFITALGHSRHVGGLAPDPWALPTGAHAAGLLTAGQSRSKACREQAAECLEIANYWSDLIKDQYEQLARQWLMLAKRAEQPS